MLKYFILLNIFYGFPLLNETAEASILIKFEDVDTSKGNIYMNLFHASEGFPDDTTKAKRSVIVPLRKKSIEVSYSQKQVGISAFQDLNGNQKLDTNSLGIPNEPFAFSQNPTLLVSAPKFSDAKVDLSQTKEIILRFKKQ